MPWHESLTKKLNQQLGSCDQCIIEYYRARRAMEEDLRHEYREEDVEVFLRLVEEKDLERILKGLDSTRETLEKLPPEKRRQNAVKVTDLYAVFESLAAEHFLNNKALLTERFDEPFQLLQTKRALRALHYVPAMLTFLFDDNKHRISWAKENWNKIPKVMTKDDYDFAIRNGLSKELAQLSEEFSTRRDPDKIPSKASRLWMAMQLIVDKVDGDLITHSLRAMEQDVYRFALDHLQLVDQDGLRALLRTIKGLLQKGPKDFWDAMGAVSPTTIVEQIFNSPRYDTTIIQVRDEGNLALAMDLLGWIDPFVASLKTSHKPQACRSLSFQLMTRLQGQQFPPLVRTECYRLGLEVLSRTLMECCEPNFNFDGVGRVVATDSLNVVAEHVQEILSALKTSTPAAQATPLYEACLKTMQYALRLECHIFRTDRYKIHNEKTLDSGFSLFQPRIWHAVPGSIQRESLPLVKVCLDAASELVGLERFVSKVKELPHPKERGEFNSTLEILFGIVSTIFERINYLDSKSLEALISDLNVPANLAKSLVLADENSYDTALDLVKTISGVSFRNEAVRFLLKTSFNDVLDAIIWASDRITSSKTYSACSQLLKICTDTLDVLCDSQSGILRLETLDTNSLKVVQAFWKSQWESLRIIYDSTPGWAFHIKVAIMSDFCRDVMQFSQHLFDQFSTFDATVTANPDLAQDDENCSAEAEGGVSPKGLLAYPSKALDAIVGFLKLRDEYLLSTCVKLTSKLLVELTNKQMSLTVRISEKLQGMIQTVPKTPTNLTAQQKADITRLLEENLGHPIVDKTQEQSGTSTPEIEEVIRQKSTTSKQGTINLDTWSAKGKFTYNIESDIASNSKTLDLVRSQQASLKPASPKLPLKPSAPIPSRPSLADQTRREAFLKSREREKEEQKRRNAEESAKARKNIPNSIANMTAGEGSALGNIGNIGKEHVKMNSQIMVPSDSESEEDDQFSDILFSKKVVDTTTRHRQPVQIQQAQPVKKVRQVRTTKDLRSRVAPDLSKIHRTILTWNFFHDADLPPGSSSSDYTMITSKFETAYDYINTFQPLLLLEAWQMFRQAREEAVEKAFSIKVVSRMSLDSLLEISATMDLAKPNDQACFEGDIILLSKAQVPSKSPEDPNCLARVNRVNRKQNLLEITLRVAHGTRLNPSFAPKITLHAQKITSLIPLEREYGALLGLPYYDLCDEIVKAYPSPLLKFQDSELSKLGANYNLNDAQAKAVKSSIANDAFTLIQG
jgi:senataxin